MGQRVQLHAEASGHRDGLQGSGSVLAYKQRQDDIGRLTRNGMSEKEARKEAISVVEGVHDIVPKLLCLQEYGGPASPMDRSCT